MNFPISFMADPDIKAFILVLCDALMSELSESTETQESSTALAAFLLMTWLSLPYMFLCF